jgi:lysophospholipase L1-like esterase
MKTLRPSLSGFFLAGLSLALPLFSPLAAQTPPPAPAPVAVAPAAPLDALGQPMENLYPEKVRAGEYAKWVAYVLPRPTEEQVWLRTLEKSLGGFYAPLLIKEVAERKFDPEASAWGYVQDDPRLPRVLIIGNSISRSYTVSVRRALTGKANVHRAPANCGRTDNFFKDAEVWLMQNGSNKWDIITVGYGIHDAGKSPAAYTDNLRKIVARLRETGARIYLVSATPWYDKKDTERAKDLSPKVNATLAAFAQEEKLELVDHHAAVIARIAELQGKDGTHFNDVGADVLGKALAAAIEPQLKPKR